jgi:peptide/nickel transport system substrate-binding protein
VVFNGEFFPGNQWVSPENQWYQESHPVPKRDVEQAKELLEEAGCRHAVGGRLHGAQQPGSPSGRRGDPGDGSEAGFDMQIRVVEFATGLSEAEAGPLSGLHAGLVGPSRSRTETSTPSRDRRPAELRPFQLRGVDAALDEARTATTFEERKAAYKKVADEWLTEGSVLYLYHRAMLIAHTNRLEGYEQMPDGLVRVVGIRLN